MRFYSFSLLVFAFSVHYLVAQPQLSPRIKLSSEGSRALYNRLTLQVSSVDQFESDYPGITIINRYTPTGALVIETGQETLSQLQGDPNIVFIDLPGSPHDEAVLDGANFHYNRIRKAQAVAPAIQGQGIRISLKEQAFDTVDIDLIGRTFTLPITSTTSSQHATQMATIIGGAGNLLEAYTGVIPEATMTSSNYDNLLPDDLTFLTGAGVYLQNHSYGVAVENYYGVQAVAYDDQVYSNPALLHVFSSGNFGSVVPDTGPYAGLQYANLSGTFKQAKNVLVVNAVDTTYSVNIRNSIGPAFDGRLKPELTTYGAGGTSEAAALVTGAAGFLSQQYKDTHSGDIPSAALLKSILIAGADDIGNPGPDFKTGYGSLNLHRSTRILENGWYHEDDLMSSETKTVILDLPSGVKTLKLVVCWSDPPGEVNTEKALVHDLDATLKIGSQTYFPWVLSSYPASDSLEAPPVRKADHLNNVELFTVDDPEPGSHTLEISVPMLTTSAQSVAIAWAVEYVDHFEWDYPYDSARLTADEPVDLLWNTTLEGTADLEVKIGDGGWEVVAASLSPDEIFTWVPPTVNTSCRLRMRIGSTYYESGPFLLSKKLNPDFSFVCNDQLGFIWDRIPEAAGYTVYRMGDQGMEPIGLTGSDTSMVIAKPGGQYFAVAPVISGWEAPRSLARDYTFSGTYCFIDFFQASKTANNEVILQLHLSTLDHIQNVSIARKYGGSEETLAAFAPDQTQFSFIDAAAEPGQNLYWATLEFDSDQLFGGALVTDTSELYVENPGKLILFPNPSHERTLNILSDGTGQVMRIYDQNGKFLFQKELFDSYDEIIIYDLRPGSYFYRLYDSGKVIDRGRFVKY